MKKKIIIILIIFLLGGIFAGITYLNKVFLPIKVKALVIKNLSSSLNRQVNFDKLQINLLKGIVITNLTISEDPRLNNGDFVKIKEISLAILYLPIFKEKKIIIPFVRVTCAQINLIRNKDNTWNFSSLIPAQGQAPQATRSQAKRAFSFAIYKISMLNTEADITDLTQEPAVSKKVRGLDIVANLSLPTYIKFALHANLYDTALAIKGSYNFADKILAASGIIKNFDVTTYKNYYTNAAEFIKNGRVNNLNFNVLFKNNAVNIKANAKLNEMFLEKDALGLKGNLNIAGALQYKIGSSTALDYKINALANEGCQVKFTPYFDYTQITNADIEFSPLKVKVNNLQARLASPEKTPDAPETKITLKGEYSLKEQELIASTNIKNLNLNNYRNAYPENINFIKGGTINDANLDINLKNNILNAKGNLNLNNLAIEKDNFGLKGNVNISGTLQYNNSPTLPSPTLGYSLLAQTNEGCQVKFMPYLNYTNINIADINLTPETIKINNFEATANQSKLTLKGEYSLKNKEFTAASTIKNLDLNTYRGFYPESMNFIKGGVISDANLDIDLKNSILNAKGNLNLNSLAIEKEGVSLKGGFNVNGTYQYSQDLNIKTAYQLKLQNLTNCEIKGKAYLNNATITKVDIDTNAQLVRINNLELTLRPKDDNKNYAIQSSGTIDITNKENPLLNITSLVKLNLEDVKNLTPQLLQFAEKAKISGIVDGSVQIQGPAKNWKQWQFTVKANTPSFSIYGLKPRDAQLNYNQAAGIVKDSELTLKLYDGTIKANLTADFNLPEEPYKINVNVNGVDLAKLKLDTAMRDKNLGGIVTLTAPLSGSAKDIISSLNGSAYLYVKNGNIWELDLMRGLGKFLLLTDFEKIVFNEIRGSFLIQNKIITTDDLQIKSAQMNLFFNGKLEFNGALDGLVDVEISPDMVNNSPYLKQNLTSLIFDEASKLIGIKVTGTIQKPKFFPHTAIQNPKEMINNLQGILTDILR